MLTGEVYFGGYGSSIYDCYNFCDTFLTSESPIAGIGLAREGEEITHFVRKSIIDEKFNKNDIFTYACRVPILKTIQNTDSQYLYDF